MDAPLNGVRICHSNEMQSAFAQSVTQVLLQPQLQARIDKNVLLIDANNPCKP